MSEALIFDTETTGVIEPIEAIEVAWMWLNAPSDHNDFVGDRFQQRLKPTKRIEYGAMATHHITDKDVADCAPSASFCFPNPKYMIGHNIDFDWKVIGKPDVKRICTLALARWVWPALDSFQLGALMYFIKGDEAKDILLSAHSAAADVNSTSILLAHLIGHYEDCAVTDDVPTTWEDIWRWSEEARLPKIMTFGKHKGMKLDDVPRDYLHWLLRQPDLEPYLELAIHKQFGR